MKPVRPAARASIESLEHRTLLSAVWNTVDDFVYAPQGYEKTNDMTPDGAGGVYAVGQASDPSINQSFAIVRHKNSGSSQWQTVATVPGPRFEAVAVAPTGEVYVAGILDSANTRIWKGSLNAEGTALSLSVVDTPSLGTWRYVQDLSIDSAGNVFAVGFYSTDKGNSANIQHWFVRKQTGGQGAFSTVDDYLYNKSDARAWGVTTVPNPITLVDDVYVVGVGGGGPHGSHLGANWIVRKSTNRGSTWSTVDSFQWEPSTNSPARARGIVADDDGTLHVVGTVATRQRTGGTDRKPTYTYIQRWFMRSSDTGGSNWSNNDIYPENTGSFFLGQAFEGGFDPEAVVTDHAGKVYVAGTVGGYSSSATARSIVRSNADGGWSTSDDFQLASTGYAYAYCMTRDSSGAIYVGGGSANHWFVRSMTPGMTAPTFSSLSIFGDAKTSANDYLTELLA